MKDETRSGALARFFIAERSRLVAYVRRLIDDAADRDGEDIVQDVMLNLFNMADVTVPMQDLAAYVYRSIRNRVIDLMRRGNHDEVSLDADSPGGTSLKELLSDNRYDTAAEADKNDVRDALYRAIDSLDDDHRAIIIMTEFEGRSFREISEAWDVPIGTLLSRKSRAMAKIRERLIHQDSEGGF